ncbi:MAG: hypothetical protein KGI71_05480 [Patescibacteria group bacterium]|nr:hypothetical protein [Patescibacteria group bacterium]
MNLNEEGPQIVRPLEAAQIPLMLPLARAYIEASGLPVQFGPAKVRQYWERLYEAQRGLLIGLWEGNDLVGVLGVHVIESMFGDGFAANEWVWWVVPSRRIGSGGLRLLREAEAWSASRHLPLLVGAYDHQNGELLAKFYDRRGFRRIGCQFLLMPQGGSRV